MKQLIRRLSRVADSSSPNSYSLLRSESTRRVGPGRKPARRWWTAVPSGRVPVYVGDEMERFVVSADLLNHPVFVTLLNKSAQVYGYEHKGALRIPCNVVVFEKVLHALRCGADDVSMDVHDLINSLATSSDDLYPLGSS